MVMGGNNEFGMLSIVGDGIDLNALYKLSKTIGMEGFEELEFLDGSRVNLSYLVKLKIEQQGCMKRFLITFLLLSVAFRTFAQSKSVERFRNDHTPDLKLFL